jgi:hypothetical protein
MSIYDTSGVSVVRSGGGAVVPQRYEEPPFTCKISVAGGWLSLEDHDHYYIAADSFQAAQMTWRRQTVQGPYVAGRFVTHAVPDTVTETLNVRVLGESQLQLQSNLADLIDAFSQMSYELVWSVEIMAYTWVCEMADYAIDFTNSLLFARNLSARFSIPRNPVIGMGSLV